LKEVQVLAESRRVDYNTVGPHSSLGYKPPARAAQLAETNAGHGKVESNDRIPLFHAPDCGYRKNSIMIGPGISEPV
jgi:hypothetical protein